MSGLPTRPSFQSANARDWSNSYLDWIEGNSLLLGVFDDLPDERAAEFRHGREEILKRHRGPITEMDRLLAPNRAKLRADKFGASKMNSLKGLVHLCRDGVALTNQVADAMTSDMSAEVNALLSDPHLSEWRAKMVDFADRVSGDNDDPLVDQPRRTRRHLEQLARRSKPATLPDAPRIDRDMYLPVLKYVHETVNLCWAFGLKGALPPTLIIAFDPASLVKETDETSIEPLAMTVEGYIEPVFPSWLDVPLQVRGGVTIPPIMHRHTEAELVTMPRKKYERVFGDYYGTVVKMMRSLSYHSNHKWKREDFEWAYRWLAEGLTQEQIAEAHDRPVNTVKTRVGSLLDKLDIEHPHN